MSRIEIVVADDDGTVRHIIRIHTDEGVAMTEVEGQIDHKKLVLNRPDIVPPLEKVILEIRPRTEETDQVYWHYAEESPMVNFYNKFITPLREKAQEKLGL